MVPIDYAFRPRLRGRLTLRRLTLRRNPWTFGDRVLSTHVSSVTHVQLVRRSSDYLMQDSPVSDSLPSPDFTDDAPLLTPPLRSARDLKPDTPQRSDARLMHPKLRLVA